MNNNDFKGFNTYDLFAAVCIVADREQVTSLIKESDVETLKNVLPALQWLLEQDNDLVKKDEARIKELCEDISAELSEI